MSQPATRLRYDSRGVGDAKPWDSILLATIHCLFPRGLNHFVRNPRTTYLLHSRVGHMVGPRRSGRTYVLYEVWSISRLSVSQDGGSRFHHSKSVCWNKHVGARGYILKHDKTQQRYRTLQKQVWVRYLDICCPRAALARYYGTHTDSWSTYMAGGHKALPLSRLQRRPFTSEKFCGINGQGSPRERHVAE